VKRRILFVDDNSNVLDGLRRMNRSQQNEWDAQYVQSGAEALNIMDSRPIDLIVADMRMPGMDGADLLREVMKRHPEVIRIVLSGQADSDLTMRVVGVAHQFIAKPCDAQTLKSIIDRAISLRTLLTDSSLGSIVSKMDTLPSVPALYLELNEVLQSPEPSILRVGQIISRDPGMTAKILQLSNSAFFGLRRHISNSVDAVAYLGLDRIEHLFLAVHAFSQFVPSPGSTFSIELLWEHSLSTAALAKTIAEQEEAGKNIDQDAFTAGLLHDIGKLMLACRLPDKYNEAINLAKMRGLPLWVAEHLLLSTTHAEIGAYLLGLWGIPDSIVEAVAYHHRPSDSVDKAFSALTALHAADCHSNINSHAEIAPPQPDMEYLSRLLRKAEIPTLKVSQPDVNTSDDEE
jgi:putative nucleotidyltransferase with HDIG domain